MSLIRSRGSAVALLAALTIGGMTSAVRATVLDFNFTYLNQFSAHGGEYSLFRTEFAGSGAQTQYHAYGDNVSAATLYPVPGDPEPNFYRYNYGEGNGFTPDVEVEYAVGANANDIRGYNGANWPAVAYLRGNPTGTLERKYYFTFTPDAGYGVSVNSFDFRSFAYDTYGMNHDVSWSIYSGTSMTTDVNGVVLLFAGDLEDSGSTGTFGATSGTIFTAQQFYTGPVTLVIHHTAGNSGFLGIDNINFDQQLVPEPGSLTLLSFAGLAVLGRRRNA